MLGLAWLAVRQAQEAIRNGRLEDAQRLLHQPAAQGHRKQSALLAHLAQAFAERGERLLRMDDPEGAWRDLLHAEQAQKANPMAERLRQALIRLTLAEVRALIQAGELQRAEQALVRYRGRGVASAEMEILDEAVKGWLLTREKADRGEFARALETIERVEKLLPVPPPLLQKFAGELGQRQANCQTLLVRLNEASAAGRWPEVIELAEQLLQLAPQHEEARRLRFQAWRAVAPATLPMQTLVEPALTNQAVGEGGPAPRFLLWIDGVGGFLICLGTRLTVGQAVPGSRVDVPVLADISRMHATLTRDGEAWLLDGLRSVQVNGQGVTQALLRADDRITLGNSCQMVFRQPVALSQSARLDLVSGHRLPLALDGVLLMADTLVLGPSAQAHVCIPDLQEPLVLFRNKDVLGIRGKGPMTINGMARSGRCVLDAQANVVTADLALCLEPAGARLG